jgi:VanZ family protein
MKFAFASIVSAAIVLVSPFMGQLQSFLRRSLSTRNYVLLFGVGVLVAVGLAILFAVTRIRERRAARFALLAGALLVGGVYMWAVGTPYPEINAVERVHFVEYGLVAFLFYQAYRPAGDLSIIVLPLLISFMVGTLDEWLQWFIPYRVGEAHDVFLNLAAIGCGLMFAFALAPPAGMSWHVDRTSARRMALTSAGVALVFAMFVSQVHLGRAIDVEGIGRFLSHYTADELLALQTDRDSRWRSHPPIQIARLSKEDQYLDEALWHVRRRNASEPFDAWHENLILERFFAPILDLPTYASATGTRWPPEQRANVAAAAANAPAAAFVSAAPPYPLVAWPRTIYWVSVIAIVLLLMALPFAVARPGLRTDPSRSDPPSH